MPKWFPRLAQHSFACFAVGAEKQISTSWSSLSQGHQAQSTPKPQNQHLTGPQLCQLAQTASTTHINASQQDDRMPSTAGWFSGAAGQLAASRDSADDVDELAGHPSRQDRHSGKCACSSCAAIRRNCTYPLGSGQHISVVLRNNDAHVSTLHNTVNQPCETMLGQTVSALQK